MVLWKRLDAHFSAWCAMIDLDSPEEFMQRRMRSVDRRRLLQPRSPQEMLDFSAKIYHKLAWPILRLSLPTSALLYAGLLFVQGFVLPGLLTTSNPGDIRIQFEEVMFVYAVALLVALPLVVVALGHTVGLTTRLVSDYVVEQKIDMRQAAADARRGASTMFGLLLQMSLRSLIVLLGSGGLMLLSAYAEQIGRDSGASDLAAVFAVLGLIAGILLVPGVMSSLCLAPSVAVLEGLKPRAAMKRSKALLRRAGHISNGYSAVAYAWTASFFVALVLWIGFNAAFGMSGLSGLVEDLGGKGILWAILAEVLTTLPTFAVIWLLVPFMTCCVTVLYYDRRVRLEALDIETMARDVIKGTEEVLLHV